MWFSIFSALRRPRPKHRPNRRKPTSTRLAVEALEGRTVPAAFTAANVSDLIADINAANLTAEADTITLAPGSTFSLTAVNNTNNTDGPTGLPVIAAAEDLTIIGNGDIIERSSANGTPAFRLFNVAAGASLTLENLTLQGGLAYAWAWGGAVLNYGALALDDVTVQNNTALGYDGFTVCFGGCANFPGGDAAGGGLFSLGILTMEGSTVMNNAVIGGRGANGTSYTQCEGACGKHTVPGSDGGSAYGGGLYVGAGAATIRNSSVTANTAQGGGAGGRGGSKGQGLGGGIYIDAAAWVGLDDFTLNHFKRNHASTSDDNIAGVYEVIV